MRDIKDYLHLYLGCEIFIFPDETLINGWLANKCEEIRGLRYKYELTITNYNLVLDAGYKPILRPLSDMTEEEEIQLQLKLHPNGYLMNAMANEQRHFSFETMRQLLSMGFDLFGLIDAGLAIEKTKLP